MSRGLPFLPATRRRTVLSRAVASWRAGNYNATLDALVDETGNGLHVRLGSAVGADTNDPLRLQYSGAKRAYFPGVSGNNVSTPAAAANRPTTYVGQKFRIRLSSWASVSPAFMTFGGKYNSTANRRSFDVAVSSGNLHFFGSDDGTNSYSASASSAALSAGVIYWLWIYWQASDNKAYFNYAADTGNNVPPSSWTAIGSVAMSGAIASLYDNATDALRLGDKTDLTNYLTGDIFYYQLELTAGVASQSIDFSQLAEPYATHVSATGETWTLNRSTSGRKLCVVDRDLLLLGTDDYLEVADSPLLDIGAGQDFFAVVAVRAYTSISGAYFLDKSADAVAVNPGYTLTGSGRGMINDGTKYNTAAGASPVGGYARLTGVGRKGALVTAWGQTGLITAAGGTGSLINAQSLFFGKVGAVYLDSEFIAAAVFRYHPTDEEIRRLAAEMGVLP